MELEESFGKIVGRRAFGSNLLWATLGGSLAGSRAWACANTEAIGGKPLVTDFGVCASYEHFAMLKQAGYGYLEDNTQRLLQPEQSESVVAPVMEKIRQEKIVILACNSFLPKSLRSVGKEVDHEGVLKYAEVAFRRAQAIGVRGIVFGSAGSRKLPEGFPRAKGEAQFVELLQKMLPIAEKHKVEVWLEPLNRREDNFINTQRQGAAIIEKVGHPSLGLTCDLFHAARNGESPEELQQFTKYMKHCHIAEEKRRTPPGTENYDFKPYLRALREGGYSGRMSMECQWKEMSEQAPKALRAVKEQIGEL